MTPRSLVAAIGTTAIAFAIAIGVAAGGVSGTVPEQIPTIAVLDDAQGRAAISALSGETRTVAGERLVRAPWNEPCVTAV